MQSVARLLDAMGVLDAEEFLENYVTTVDRRIYVPFEIGEGNSSWGLWDQLVVCVHEHQHVEQLDRDGWLIFARVLRASAT